MDLDGTEVSDTSETSPHCTICNTITHLSGSIYCMYPLNYIVLLTQNVQLNTTVHDSGLPVGMTWYCGNSSTLCIDITFSPVGLGCSGPSHW